MANYSLNKDTYIKARIGWQGLTTSEYLDYGDYYLVTGTDIKNGVLDFSSCVFVSKGRFDQDPHIQLKKGDVLITKDGTIGKVAYVDLLPLPATLNSGVFVIRCDNSKITQKYFYYVLKSKLFKNFIDQTSAGSTIVHLYQKDIVKFNFEIPDSLQVQKKCVAVMESIDNTIESVDNLITKKRNMFQGILTTLFEKHQTTLIGNMCDVKRGSVLTKSQCVDGGVPVVAGGKRPAYFHNTSNRTSPVITISASGANAGFVNYYDVPIFASDCSTIESSSDYDIKFIYYCLLYKQKLLYKTQTGGAQPHVHPKDIKGIMIPDLKIDEQKRCSVLLDSFANEIESLENKKQKLINIREGLLNGLFTGTVDVPTDCKEV